MRALTYIVMIFVILGINGSANGQSFQTKLDSTIFLIGDQTRVTVTGRLPIHEREVKIQFKSLCENTEGLEYVSQSALYINKAEGVMHYRQDFLVALFDTGHYYIPSIPIVISSMTQKDTLFTLPIPIQVAVVQLEVEDLAPNKPIEREFWTLEDAKALGILLGVIFLLGILFLWMLLLYIKRKNQKRLEQTITIPKTPFQLANDSLYELEKLDYLSKGKSKEHYSTLCLILRSYFEAVFHFPALESTTREIGYGLDVNQFAPSHKKEIIDELVQIDLIKYAKAKSDPTAAKHAIADMRKMIMKIQEIVIARSIIDEEE